MVTIEDKIRLFSKIVYEKIDEELSKELEEFEKKKIETLESEKKKIEQQRERQLKEINKKYEIKAKEVVSKSKFEMRKEILELKEEIINKTLQEISSRLREFADSNEYENYLFNGIENNLKQINIKDFILYVTNKDFSRYKGRLKNKFNMEIKPIERDIIGGFIFQNKNNKFRMDYSLYSRMEYSREKIGIKITELINQ